MKRPTTLRAAPRRVDDIPSRALDETLRNFVWLTINSHFYCLVSGKLEKFKFNLIPEIEHSLSSVVAEMVRLPLLASCCLLLVMLPFVDADLSVSLQAKTKPLL